MLINTDFLKKLGIEDEEIIKTILSEHDKEIAGEKTQRDNLLSRMKNLESKEKESEQKLISMEDYDTLKEQITALTNEKAEMEKAHKSEMDELRKFHEVESYLMASDARMPKAVMPFIDMTKVVVKDGQLEGIEEQVKTLKDNSKTSFLFGAEIHGFNPKDPDSGNTGNTQKSFREALEARLNGETNK